MVVKKSFIKKNNINKLFETRKQIVAISQKKKSVVNPHKKIMRFIVKKKSKPKHTLVWLK